jgi:indolepyruvate ferredoxin oxidoreductase
MELNQVAVAENLAAFQWGRLAAEQPDKVQAALQAVDRVPTTQVLHFMPPSSGGAGAKALLTPAALATENLASLVARRVAFLTEYQNAAYARTYQAFVEQVQAREVPLVRSVLTEAVARNLFKLMANKDEYEVARLHSDPAFLNKVREQFEGDFSVHFHLAPSGLSAKNEKGQPIKRAFGPSTLVAFRWLARLKGLRGTPLDLFGRSAERRTERALVGEYRACIEELCLGLNPRNHALAVEIARLPDQIRGFGHVKDRNLAAVRPQWTRLMQTWRDQA